MESADQDDICVLCCREISIYATGRCDHRVCYECSTRMRVLCDTNECPICRRNMSIVIFTHEPQVFTTLAAQYPLRDKKYNISFEDAQIKKAFELLLENKCKICKEVFLTFEKLKEHTRRLHECNFCDLCVTNLKIFTFERKCYTKKDLATHRRIGDPDDTSLRGHPLCEFCDMRYVDDDALFLHLRRDHYFCHFCDADSLSPFYNDYDSLKVHFRKDHYLCEEGDCAREKFVGAFRTAIDLKAHVATCHAKNKSKAEMKQARTLEVGFTCSYRDNPSGSYGFRQNDSRDGRFGQHRKRNIEENSFRDSSNAYLNNNQDAFNTQSTQDFPYLSEDAKDDLQVMYQNNSSPSSNMRNSVPSSNMRNSVPSSNINSFTVQSYTRNNPYNRRDKMSIEDFPALSTATVSVTSDGFNNHSGKVNFSVNQQNRNANLSIHLSQNNGTSSSASVVHVNGNKKNIGKKAPRFPDFQAEDESEKNAQKANPTWITSTKKTVTSFDEDFPKLVVKEELDSEPENISGLSNFPNPKVESSAAQFRHSGVTVAESPVNGEPFVTIKCRRTKKKPHKPAAEANRSKQEDNSKAQSSFKLFSSYVSNSKTLDDQENKDPVLDLVNKVNLQAPVQNVLDSYWEETVSFANDDFPPLEVPEVPKRPPGFDAKTAPPGFGAKVGTVKSSSSPLTISLSSIARQITLPNQKNNNNKPKSDYVNLPKECFTSPYNQPLDFDKRNDRLIERIRELSDNTTFIKFKVLSGNFRKGQISADEYHTMCLDVLGNEPFLEIYTELVSLLPDITKQHELLAIHNRFLNRCNGAVPKNRGDTSPFMICEICSQVLIKLDYISHKFVYHDITNKRK